jgi:hypothetical protein
MAGVGGLVYDVRARYSASRERRRSSRKDEVAHVFRRVEEHINVERRLPCLVLDEYRTALRACCAIAETAR